MLFDKKEFSKGYVHRDPNPTIVPKDSKHKNQDNKKSIMKKSKTYEEKTDKNIRSKIKKEVTYGPSESPAKEYNYYTKEVPAESQAYEPDPYDNSPSINEMVQSCAGNPMIQYFSSKRQYIDNKEGKNPEYYQASEEYEDDYYPQEDNGQ